VTKPAKIGHLGSQNLTTFQSFGSHNFLFQYGMIAKISELADNFSWLYNTAYRIQILNFSMEICFIKWHGIF